MTAPSSILSSAVTQTSDVPPKYIFVKQEYGRMDLKVDVDYGYTTGNLDIVLTAWFDTYSNPTHYVETNSGNVRSLTLNYPFNAATTPMSDTITMKVYRNWSGATAGPTATDTDWEPSLAKSFEMVLYDCSIGVDFTLPIKNFDMLS